MGNECCNGQKLVDPNSQKIIRLIQKHVDSSKFEQSEDNIIGIADLNEDQINRLSITQRSNTPSYKPVNTHPNSNEDKSYDNFDFKNNDSQLYRSNINNIINSNSKSNKNFLKPVDKSQNKFNNSPHQKNKSNVGTGLSNFINEDNQKESLLLQIFETENEIGKEILMDNKNIDITGMSQIFSGNKLYIIGSNTKEKTVSEFSSSFLYIIDIMKDPLTIDLGVNSIYLHYYPTLTILRMEFLIVIGGKKNKKCEYYSISNKRWKDLPELPEERYGSSAVCDNINNLIFVFGGLNGNTNKCCFTVFKLNVNICVKWDTMIIQENSNYLGRMNTCIIKKNNGSILLLGGGNGYGIFYDDVIEVDIKNKVFRPKVLNTKLPNKTEFISLRQGNVNSTIYCYAFDETLQDSNKIFKFDDNFSSIVSIEDS